MMGISADALRSPELFPQAYDPRNDTVTLIRLTRHDYTAASFLDDRILRPDTPREPATWPVLECAIEAANLAERCAFIFHIGHVGSTLLARLIGAHAGAFALREPAILRTFAQLRVASASGNSPVPDDGFARRLTGSLKLLSRTFEPSQRALVKATSFVSEMAEELLTRPAAAPALVISAAPEIYLATIFGGENSRREISTLLPGRAHRLARRAGIDVRAFANLSEGESIALSWACETAALTAAAQRAPRLALRIDFEGFLENPTPGLLAALTHLGIPARPAEVEAIVAGPLMRRYSKAPEFAYDSTLRAAVLDQARTVHGREISHGLAWLGRMARAHAELGAALEFAGN
jgi:hypothetical protein